MSIYDAPFLLYYCLALSLVFGACMGSFLNCAAWRIAHGESFVRGRSRCPECSHTLSAAELVPVFSWLLLRGRCRWCGKRISPRYVLAEVLFALLTAACLLRFDLSVLCLRNYVFLCCLFCLSLVDLECSEIPDGCHILSLLAWLAALPFLAPGWRGAALHLLSAAVFGGGTLLVSLLMDRAMKKETLGGGDIKLFAVMGLYLGLVPSLFALLLSCLLGLLLAAALGRGRGQAFPFGPAIAAAAAVMLFFGDALAARYLALL